MVGRTVVPAAIASVVVVAGLTGPAAAQAAASWQTLTYHGERLTVPASWAVDDLAASPTTCVRFDVHAVYEGTPGATQACPAELVGVTEAVALQPYDGAAQVAGSDLVAGTVGGQRALVNPNPDVSHRDVVAFPAAGVLATISWGADPGTARTVLASMRAVSSGAVSSGAVSSGGASSPGAAPSLAGPSVTPALARRAAPAPATSPSPISIGSVSYTGPGFDTCYTPSTDAMAAWRASSPYRAVGVYIGGANQACVSTPATLNSTWVDTEVASGWHLIPLYVGLQPSCADQRGLAAISPSSASAEGAAAAQDAAKQAEALGMGAGSPIYDDMEAWNTNNPACSSAVVSYVRAWSATLASIGFASGVYGSADAGVNQDLAPLWGTSGAPNYLYFAQWDGEPDTSSSYIPTAEYPGQTRIKQYQGNTSQTWGGVGMNVDLDWVAAPVVGNQRPAVNGLSPSSAAVGRTIRVSGSAFVPGRTSVAFGGVPAGNVKVTSSGSLTATVPPQTPASVAVTVRTRGGTSNIGTGGNFTYVPIVSSAVDPSTGGYWMTTSRGNVYHYGAPFIGSAATTRLPAPIVATAVDPVTRGYWMTTSRGNVYHYGAPFLGSMQGRYLPAPVVGMAADPATGGYWLVTAKGNVYGFDAPFLGSMRGRYLPAGVVGIAADPTTGGYRLVTAKGNVYGFRAPFVGSLRGRYVPASVAGITADSATGGFWLVTAKGNVYGFDAPFLGSTAQRRLPAPVVALSAAGRGYLLTTSAGNVYNFATTWFGGPAAS